MFNTKGSRIQPAPCTAVDVAEIERKVADLKLLAGLSPKQSDRIRCCSEILRLRTIQYSAELRSPVPPFGTTVTTTPSVVAAPLDGAGQPLPRLR